MILRYTGKKTAGTVYCMHVLDDYATNYVGQGSCGIINKVNIGERQAYLSWQQG